MRCAVVKDYTKMLDLCSSSSPMKNSFSLPLHKKYRGHFEIIALLLEAVKDNGATKFSIMKHANTNYKQLKKYLRTLTEIGFIEMDKKEDQCLYRTSEKGLNFLRQYYVLLGMLLSALARNKSASIVYKAEYDAASGQQQSAAQLVRSLQHNS
jgi:predicted transcriptional regulator